jgi:2-polyprenyl-6-methoxyphenol hydroxylase-like FAD-dependent oxidoreductase
MGILVAVIGGSIGGLSSALALHSINCDVKVFEKSSGEKSRGRSCSANGTC